jgi:hypothetical protein
LRPPLLVLHLDGGPDGHQGPPRSGRPAVLSTARDGRAKHARDCASRRSARPRQPNPDREAGHVTNMTGLDLVCPFQGAVGADEAGTRTK